MRAQLERILVSPGWANGGRLSRLLKYVVDRTLAGEGGQLKEYTLGVEVFDRASEYDPRIDSIVRVEARRLRAKLEDYYTGPGASDPVLITIPRGGYVAVFALSQPPAQAVVSAVVAPTRRRNVIAVAVLTVVAVGAVSLTSGRWLPGQTTPEASSTLRIAVLPFAHFSVSPEHNLLAARITDGVTSELAKISALSVVSRTSAAQFVSEQAAGTRGRATARCSVGDGREPGGRERRGEGGGADRRPHPGPQDLGRRISERARCHHHAAAAHCV
ncbi:MAG TPA: hypothetical protein VNJ02_01770 [Vicinamibacterales bacterium]|nr:hypothetical protein [Vicinamibacterales bacterium]